MRCELPGGEEDGGGSAQLPGQGPQGPQGPQLLLCFGTPRSIFVHPEDIVASAMPDIWRGFWGGHELDPVQDAEIRTFFEEVMLGLDQDGRSERCL